MKGDAEALARATLTGARVATNSASFKAMERPVVVLGLDLPDRHGSEQVRRAIYAAATRARSLLVVVGEPGALAVTAWTTWRAPVPPWRVSARAELVSYVTRTTCRRGVTLPSRRDPLAPA